MFTETCRRNILQIAKAYGQATGRSSNGISMRFYGNGTFFRELEDRNRSITIERYGEMLADFARSWPTDAPWPDLQPIHFSRENLVRQRYAQHESGKIKHDNKKQKV